MALLSLQSTLARQALLPIYISAVYTEYLKPHHRYYNIYSATGPGALVVAVMLSFPQTCSGLWNPLRREACREEAAASAVDPVMASPRPSGTVKLKSTSLSLAHMGLLREAAEARREHGNETLKTRRVQRERTEAAEAALEGVTT